MDREDEMRILTDRICCLSVTLLLASAAMAGCDSAVPQQSTKVTRSQPSPKPVNRSIERMLENAEGVLNINATLLVAYIGQIERHKIKELTLVDADQVALECLPRLRGLESLRLDWLCGSPSTNAQSERPDLTPLGQLVELKSLTFAPRTDADLVPLKELRQLETLDLQRSSGLSDLTPLDNLSRLTSLTIRNLGVDCRLEPLAEMNELEELAFHVCPGLADLKSLAGKRKLEKIIFFACPAVTDLRPLASLKNLETIEFDGCPGISDLSPLAGLKKLRSISFDGQAPDLSPLATTPIESIEFGQSVELQGHSNLSHVTSLILNADSSFDNLASMPNLRSVEVRGRAADEQVLEALAGSDSLQYLRVFNLSATNLAPLGTLQDLRELELPNMRPAVKDLGPLANLKRLSSLRLVWGQSLEDLHALRELGNLKHLDLISATRPTSGLNGLAALNQLESLKLVLWGIGDLKPLAALTRLRKLELAISDSEEIDNLGALADLQDLEELHLSFNRCAIDDLTPLESVRGLKGLKIGRCRNRFALSPLVKQQGLVSVSLISCEGAIDLDPLGEIASLERISLYGCTAIQDVSPLAKLVDLKSLDLRECSNVTNLRALMTLTNLEDLRIPPTVTDEDLRTLVDSGTIDNSQTKLLLKAPHLRDLSPLASMTKLEELSLENCYPMDLSPLADLGLKKLVLRNCYPRRPESGNQSRTMLNEPQSDASRATDWDLTPLERLQSLKRLEIADCHFPINFEPIAQLKGLDTLWWTFHENEFEELLPITTLTHLRALALEGASNISEAEVARLRQMMPRTHVDGTEIVE